jgi:hypothetical protein
MAMGRRNSIKLGVSYAHAHAQRHTEFIHVHLSIIYEARRDVVVHIRSQIDHELARGWKSGKLGLGIVERVEIERLGVERHRGVYESTKVGIHWKMQTETREIYYIYEARLTEPELSPFAQIDLAQI